jgi:PAB1-binding protein PBP1
MLVLTSLLSLPLAGTAADKLNVKLGLWEITTTTQMTGVPQLEPELLAKMSPQQRAQMEAAFKAEASKGPHKDVSKECVTQKDVDHPFSASSDRKDCKQTTVSTTRTSQEVHMVCTGSKKGTGTFRVNAPNPQTISGDFNLTSGDGANPMVIKTQLKGRWLSPDCGEESEDEESEDSEDTDND